VMILLSDTLQNFDGFLGDFGADSVAGKDEYG